MSNVHRRTKTTNEVYNDEAARAAVSERPYNLTKLMHKYKLVRSVNKS